MTKIYLLAASILLIFTSCKGQANSKEFSNESDRDTVREEKIVKDVALSFHRWYMESSNADSDVWDFNIVESKNGHCELDSSGYFNSLRRIGTISEKFIQNEWNRVSKCADFLRTLKWRLYINSEAYEFQDYCDIYYYYWTRTQEPFDGVEVKRILKQEDKYVVTLVFYYGLESKVYSHHYFPVVTVEKENNHWRISKIEWLEGE